MKLLALILIALGALCSLLSLFGIYRFEDPLRRIHAATLGETLAPLLLFLGVGILRPELVFWGKLLCILLFLWLTAPLAAHLIGRCALEEDVQALKEKEGKKRRRREDDPV